MYIILRSVGFMISLVPDVGLELLARLILGICYDGLRLRRKMVETNIERALGADMSPEEIRILGRKAALSFIYTILEFFRSWQKPMTTHIDFTGAEHLQKALAEGKGAYVLCAHLGNWEAFGAKVSTSLCPAHILVKKVGTGGVNRFVEETRARNGFLAIGRGSVGDGVRGIIKALRRGEVVGFVLDQTRPGEPKVDFFGIPAKTNTGLATLWERYQAPVVPGYIERLKLGHHRIHFLPPLELSPEGGDKDGRVLVHTQAFNHSLESMIRLRPDQYFWFHNRFKP